MHVVLSKWKPGLHCTAGLGRTIRAAGLGLPLDRNAVTERSRSFVVTFCCDASVDDFEATPKPEHALSRAICASGVYWTPLDLKGGRTKW